MVALAIMPALAGAWLALRPPAGFARLRDLAFDEYQVARPRAWSPDIPVRVVDIDEASLKAYGQWPWPRLLLAKLTDRLAADGAAAVAFDVVFAEPDRNSPDRIVATLPPSAERDALAAKLAGQPGDDALFAAAIARAPVARATKLVNVGGDAPPVKAGFATAGAPAAPFLPRLDGAVGPLPALAAAAKGVGAVNFFPDRDLVVRKIPLLISVGPPGGPVRYVPSLAAEALRIAQGASTVVVKTSDASGGTTSGAADGVIAVKIGALEIPTDRDGQVRVHFAGYRRARHVSLVDVMEGRIPEGALTGKIVFVGATALELLDLRSTPLQGAVPGVDLHAELAEQALSGAGLARPDWARDAEALAAFLGALAVGGLALTRRPVAAALGAATGVVGAAAGSFALFASRGLLFDAAAPALAMAAAYGLSTFAVYRGVERERRAVRVAFSRYVAPALVERLAADPSALKLGGETKVVTVLFCDARDFTARAEALDAQGVVAFLNRLHTALTDVVLAEGGTVDKYLGDGLMAFWNAPLDAPDHAVRACRAALAMLRAVAALDADMGREATARGVAHAPLRIGIGVNTGAVHVGNMGSERRFDYSIVGDAVNVAARLESATKEAGRDVLASAATAAAAPGFRFAPVGGLALKGKSGAVEAFALEDALTSPAS